MRLILFALILPALCLLSLPRVALSFDQPPIEQFHPGLSLQGFTGILNTPSAHVTRQGSFYGLYSNQKESKWRDRTSFQDNYLFSVGLFSIAEIGGRLTWAPEVGAQDLSANVKFTSEPFFRKYPHVPVLAFGMQDISGGASFFKTKYIVLSEDIWRFRLSGGYGTGPDRMEGAFAGGEFKAHDWIYLLGDYDTKETNVGARIVMPQFWKTPIQFTATAKTSLDHKPGNFDIGFGLSFPLDFKIKTSKPEEKDSGQEAAGHAPEAEKPALLSTNIVKSSPDINKQSDNALPITRNMSSDALASLRDRLVKAGFQNVRTGDFAGIIAVIEYENSIFNHNELDAIGVVTGMAVEALKESKFESLRIIVKKKKISVLQIAMPLNAAMDLMKNGKTEALKSNMAVSNHIDDNTDTAFVDGDSNSSLFATSLVLWPGLNTWVGTDYSAFDYVLSIKPDLNVNLWKGGLLNARWDIPLLWSDNLKEGKPFRGGRTPGRMERLILSQGIGLLPGLIANISGGMLTHDLNGVMNEMVWQPGEGAHRIRLSQTWGHNDKTRANMESYLASYRYYFSPLDLSLEGTAGKFWAQDSGYSVELKRFFGDTAFSIYYKNTTIKESMSQGYPTHWQAAGVQFAFPLTPEKDMKHYYKMQLRGTEEWSYAQETTVAGGNSANANYLPPVPLAVAPRFTTSIHNQYTNRDRLNASYIKSHLERLRDAWLKYGEKMQGL